MASLALAFAPGPDNIFTIAQSATCGVRSGLCVVLGLCTGVLVQTVAAALGLASVFSASPALFWGLRIAGALYLFYLAVMAWRHARDPVGRGEAQRLPGLLLWRRGLIMNLTNPKVVLFFVAFFPQFLPKGATAEEAAVQMAVQGATFLLATLAAFSLLALAAGSLGALIASPRGALWLNRGSAVIFVALAVSALCL